MTEKSGRGWWRFFAIALVLVQLPVLVRTVADPQQSDFANYFTPAFVLARGGDLSRLYDRDVFSEAMAGTGIRGLGSFIPHPPANALWLLPFATLPPNIAKALWSTVLLLSTCLAIAAVHRLRPGFELWTAIVIVLAPTLAIRNGLAFGQPYLILTAFLLVGVLSLEKGRPFRAGFLLGLGVSFKPYATGVGILFLHRERLRSLAGFLSGALAPSLVLWAFTGSAPFVEFSSKVVPWMLRGDIQDPFAPGWGSAMALTNRLLRYEPDLNPEPWLQSPLFARFLGAAVSTALLSLGVLLGRRALDLRLSLDAVGVSIALALAASPLVASYHLVLLVVPVLAVTARLQGPNRGAWLAGWAILGSSLTKAFPSSAGALAPLAYARFFGVLGLALAVAWPFLNRRRLVMAIGLGAAAGVVALPWNFKEEAWPRIESARGYSMMSPYFCGEKLRWKSPSADGRRLESRGDGEDCAIGERTGATRRPMPDRPRVIASFTHDSWNLYLEAETPREAKTRLTFSDANEIDPVLTPDGCAVVFASDQGRGLGSTALYRLDISPFIGGCEKPERVLNPR